MLYSSLKPCYKTQLKMTPGFKQVNYAKMAMKYLTSTDKIKGVALLYSTKYKTKTVVHTKYSSFESGVWHIQFGLTHYTLLGICHPPVGMQQGITNSIFIDDLTELLMEVLFNHKGCKGCIILGDINIHFNEPEDNRCRSPM